MERILLAVFVLILTKLPAAESVDEQIDIWGKVWNEARSQTHFSWKKTHVKDLIGRVAYMADYVKAAVWGDVERENVIGSVMQKAGVLDESKCLSFQQAFRCFDVLATICDKTEDIPTIASSDELPESWFEQKLRGTNNEYLDNQTLEFSDVYFLCVPKGGLKIERFVDAFLRKRPYNLVALANNSIADGGLHGGHYQNVLESYEHDVSHAVLFMTNNNMDPSGYMGDKWFQHFWPGYEKVKTVRDRLVLQKMNKIVDTFLFIFFHEAYAYFGTKYQEKDITTLPFDDFIDAMKEVCDDYREHDFARFPIDPYVMLRNTTMKPISADLNIDCCLNDGSRDIRPYLSNLPEDGKISFDYTLFGTAICWTAIPERACTITVNDIRADLIDGFVKVQDLEKEYLFNAIKGPQYLVKHKVQDSLKLLKAAGSDLGGIKRATIFNVQTIDELVSKLFEDAVTSLKREWTTLQTAGENFVV